MTLLYPTGLQKIKDSLPEMPWDIKTRLMKDFTLTSEQCNYCLEHPKVLQSFIRIKRDVLREVDKEYK